MSARAKTCLWAAVALFATHPVPARAEAPEPRVRSVSFARLGAGPELLATFDQQTLLLHFATRRDSAPTSVVVRLQLARARLPEAHAAALEVRLGGELLGRVDATARDDEPAEVAFEGDPKLLGLGNALELHLVRSGPDACNTRVPPGAWRFLEGGSVEVSERPLPVEKSLALLPLPFFDAATEDDHTLTFAFDEAPDAETLRAAALIAGALGRPQRASGALRFEVVIRELPERTAVAFVRGVPAASGATTSPFDALSIARAPEGTVELADHPAAPDTRLLVVSGADSRALAAAALTLATSAELPPTPRLVATHRTLPPLGAANDAPRWLILGARARLGELGAPRSETAGARTLAVSFRTPPDLFMADDEPVLLEVTHAEDPVRPEDADDLVIDLNGTYLGALRRADVQTGIATTHLPIPRGLLHGPSVLHLHLTPSALRERCPSEGPREVRPSPPPTVTAQPSLRLDAAATFAPLPDVAAFAAEGHPFTRLADLSQTTLVLPRAPSPAAIASALSFVAHAAQVTGLAPARFTLVTGGPLDDATKQERDLLVIGAPSELADLGDWPLDGPLDPRTGTAPRTAARAVEQLRRTLAGEAGDGAARAATLFASPNGLGAALMFESPFSRGRTVVVLTGDRPEHVPDLGALQGGSEARTERGDVLIVAGSKRALLSIGPSWVSSGATGTPLLRARWWLARNPLALLSTLALGALLLSRSTTTLLGRLAERRLSPPDGGAVR